MVRARLFALSLWSQPQGIRASYTVASMPFSALIRNHLKSIQIFVTENVSV